MAVGLLPPRHRSVRTMRPQRRGRSAADPARFDGIPFNPSESETDSWLEGSDIRAGGLFPAARLDGFGGPVALSARWRRSWSGAVAERDRDAAMRSRSASRCPGRWRSRSGFSSPTCAGGFWGAWAGGWAFILPNFVMVAALGALYVYFGGSAGSPGSSTASARP